MKTVVIVAIVVALVIVAFLLLRKRPAPRGPHAGTTPRTITTASATAASTDKPATSAKTMYSLVLLLKAPRTVDVASLTTAAETAFSAKFTADGLFMLRATPRPGLFMVGTPDARLAVINMSQPYFNEEKLTDAVDHERVFLLRKALQDHKAWLSVDWIGQLPPGGADAAYGRIAKLAAALFSDDVLAIYCTSTGQGHGGTAKDAEILRGPNPLALFDLNPEDKVIMVGTDKDAQLAAATAEAKRRWPEFLQAFNARRPRQGFAVKKCFTSGDKVEHMWVELSAINGNTLTGKLANDPQVITTLKSDDPVTLSTDEVEDWIYSNGKQMIGGFSAKIVDQAK